MNLHHINSLMMTSIGLIVKEKSNSIPDEVADEGDEESVPDTPSTSNRSKSKSSKSKPVSEKVIGSKKHSDEDQVI